MPRRKAKNRSIRLTDEEITLFRLAARATGNRAWTDWARNTLVPLARRIAREEGLLQTQPDPESSFLFR